MVVLLVFGGGPNRESPGLQYWKHPSPINEYMIPGHSGYLSTFIATVCFPVFAFGFAPELPIVAGGGMQSPTQSTNHRKRYFYRLVLLYILEASAISGILPE
ncbi:hypothetical protein BDV32DRAFT_153943 [Aspergillus pseudonomiae]|uniref:Uncharacterized protein n=1 Tax=Aspergillus pseudonomiae TaxID=1506151 RepID=A0A5N6HNA7_9EURO|nr:uncharacterized protein BDV37DRAFT_285580 [Aspergillus pseudonomiae]KAB8255805.1 hypothetical protein BDV32DRAFT_153943 [Aspergillus pseudonomiae]KAE8401559.1 hypothetical protein BDV37DRAFT_285580 [Aspergillus pseudonomiae]